MEFVTDVKLVANGRMVLPQAVHEAMGVSGETRIIVTVDSPEVRLRQHGSGLGDRTCMALTMRLGVPVLTTDRAWAKLKIPDLAVEVVR